MTVGQTIGPYSIIAKLGEGAMGEVYRARDTKLDRDVALKILPESFASDPDRLMRFEREAKTLASLNHPHIAQIHGFEQSGTTSALVMELVEGEDLSHRIARGPMPIADALPIARQIAEALEAAHEQGIIHRDLKPANIKVRDDGTVKVLDFGLAKTAAAGASGAPGATVTSPAMTMQGVILGTAAYMSPEQAKGKPVDRRADIWAFGCVLYEMLAGTRPFNGEDITDTIVSVMSRDPDWSRLPDATPPPMRLLLRRCLEKSASKRLPHIGVARLEIEDALNGVGGVVAAVPAAPPVMPSRKRLAIAMAVLLVAVASTALAMWRLMRPAIESRPLVRLNAEVGDGAVLGIRMLAAISPDGRRIAYHVRDQKGTRRLATRLLEQPTATVLPGTEDGADPFFSPDGQWIVFHADSSDKLKKIRVDGGAAMTLCDASTPRGGTWTNDGRIVVALSAVAGLSSVAANGGAPQPLTTLRENERTHRWPQVLPGGDLVLFTSHVQTTDWDAATIQVLALGTGQVTPLITGGYFGRYVDGHLLYITQGTLYSVPFDLGSLRVGDTPVPLLDDVAADRVTGAGWFDMSRTGIFVYRSGKAAAGFSVSWLDSLGNTAPLVSAQATYRTPRLSPDGRRLALATTNATGIDIYVFDLDRDALTRVTFSGRENGKPLWTPDGRHLVYRSAVDQSLWWTRADGSGDPQRLLQVPAGNGVSVSATAFSPDGRFLVYSATGDVYRLPLDLSDPERPRPGTPEALINGPAVEVEAGVSPDGRWLSHLSTESGRSEVYVRPFGSAATGKWQVSTTGGEYSFWSRDGRALYFLGLDRRIMVVDYTTSSNVFSAGRPRVWSNRLIRSTTEGLHPLDLAPDGKRFVVLDAEADLAGEEAASPHATFLFNFADELRRRVK